MSTETIQVDQLAADAELDSALDKLRRLGFRPVAVPWTCHGVTTLVNGLVFHQNGVSNLLAIPREGDAHVVRAGTVNDAGQPSCLLDDAVEFSAPVVVAAHWLRDVIVLERTTMIETSGGSR